MNEIQGICGTVIVPAGVFFVQRGEWKMPLIAIGFGGVFMGMESLDRYEDKQREKVIMRVSVGSIVLNLGLSMFKLMAGFLAGSSAMISDGVHSASDVLSTGIVIVGARLAGKEADAEHPYGHDRLECVACILLAVLLGVTGLGIGITGVKTLVGMMGIGADAETLQSSLVTAPKMLALVAAVLSILVKEGMYRHTRTVAKRIESGALLADAWHHRSDALSSVGSFIGIFGAQHGILWWALVCLSSKRQWKFFAMRWGK